MRLLPAPAFSQAVCFLVILIPLVLLPGCRRSDEEIPVVPPATHPLTRRYIGYAVVNVSFTHLLNEPGGVSESYLRRGTVVRILERRKGGDAAESWVLVEGNYQGSGDISRGWLPETALDVFNNESQAITASRNIVQ